MINKAAELTRSSSEDFDALASSYMKLVQAMRCALSAEIIGSNGERSMMLVGVVRQVVEDALAQAKDL